MRRFIFGFVTAALIVGGVLFFLPRREVATGIALRVGASSINVELARTPDEHARGLMYRKSMPEDSGMLFLFSESREQIFWNKNTLIPLDIIWVQDKQVVGLIQLPVIADGLKTVSSQKNVDAVLEVNLGWAERHGIKIGDALEW